jgi:hypothetical protein
MNPAQQAANLVSDLSDVVQSVSLRAARRESRHLLFVLDRDDATARELLTTYAPIALQLARGGCDDVDVVALGRADGLRLLRAPDHRPTIFHTVADQIEADQSGKVIGLCVTGGAFARFEVVRARELN